MRTFTPLKRISDLSVWSDVVILAYSFNRVFFALRFASFGVKLVGYCDTKISTHTKYPTSIINVFSTNIAQNRHRKNTESDLSINDQKMKIMGDQTVEKQGYRTTITSPFLKMCAPSMQVISAW
jgi:hypothetical protein